MVSPRSEVSVVISRGDEVALPARLNMEIVTTLQQSVAPQIFTPRAVYDGRKNLFAIRELPFGDADSREVRVYLALLGSAHFLV